MENVAIKGGGGNDVQHKNWKGKIIKGQNDGDFGYQRDLLVDI